MEFLYYFLKKMISKLRISLFPAAFVFHLRGKAQLRALTAPEELRGLKRPRGLMDTC